MDGNTPYSVFPSTGLRVFSALIHSLGSSLIAFLFARRSVLEELSTWAGWRQLSFARLCLVLVFVDSWLFLTSTGILIHGVGLEMNMAACSMAIFACIVLYTSSKALMYMFLTEKVWIVWSTGNTKAGVIGKGRFQSPVYLACIITIALYSACAILALIFRIAEIQNDHICTIGLERPASLTLLAYDVFISLLLTMLFVYPLLRRNINPRIRRVGTQTLISSAIALAISSVNMAVLTAMHGHQPGWVCLASCAADVTINALVLYFVTGGQSRWDEKTAIMPGMSFVDGEPPASGNRITFGRNGHGPVVPVQVLVNRQVEQDASFQTSSRKQDEELYSYKHNSIHGSDRTRKTSSINFPPSRPTSTTPSPSSTPQPVQVHPYSSSHPANSETKLPSLPRRPSILVSGNGQRSAYSSMELQIVSPPPMPSRRNNGNS